MTDTLYVATRKGLFRVDHEDGRFEIGAPSFRGASVTMALVDPRDGTVYAGLQHGHFGRKLHRSRDGGRTFEECGAPKFPEAEGEDAVSVDQIWALEAGHASQPGVLWCGTIPGGLFVSRDFGETWTLVRSLWDDPRRKNWFGGGADKPGIHSICVDPRDPSRILIAVSCGGVWQSEDGGEHWGLRSEGLWAAYMPPEQKNDPDIQDPHRMVACPAAPDRLWIQHHNGIFISSDGAANWRELSVSPSSFGFAVAVHPSDPNTAWFVPAVRDEERIPVDGQVVVTRTRDGGASFDVLRSGLPQKDAYDLTLRHALDVDRHGRSLAFGSTTGSLWWSSDGGDHFQTVSNHLPPIYCVRFA